MAIFIIRGLGVSQVDASAAAFGFYPRTCSYLAVSIKWGSFKKGPLGSCKGGLGFGSESILIRAIWLFLQIGGPCLRCPYNKSPTLLGLF